MARRTMTAAQRAAVSKRMKAFWRRRRGAKRAPAQHAPKAPKREDEQDLIRLAMIGVVFELTYLCEVAEDLKRRLL